MTGPSHAKPTEGIVGLLPVLDLGPGRLATTFELIGVVAGINDVAVAGQPDQRFRGLVSSARIPDMAGPRRVYP